MTKRKREPSGEGRTNKLKFNHLMEGKRTIEDSSIFLKEVLAITKTGNAQDLAALPEKIHLLQKGIEKVNNHLEQILRLDGNLRLAKDLVSSSRANENSDITVRNRLLENSKLTIEDNLKSLPQQRLENATKDVVFPPSSAKKTKRTQSEEELQELIGELEKYQAPNVDGSRYCIRQLITLLKIDQNSPIYQKSVLNMVTALQVAGRCVVNYHTLRRRIYIYNARQILPIEGDEGCQIGRPSLLPTHEAIIEPT